MQGVHETHRGAYRGRTIVRVCASRARPVVIAVIACHPQETVNVSGARLVEQPLERFAGIGRATLGNWSFVRNYKVEPGCRYYIPLSQCCPPFS
jgi:hypothetical protein